MTRTKIWRLSLAAILAFGWLFITPAQGESDPITIAAADIAELNKNLENLVNKTATQELINIAQSKYEIAVQAKQNLIDAQNFYDIAVSDGSTATINLNNAQNQVDTQQPIRDAAYSDLQTKQDALDTANINLLTAQQNGEPPTGTLSAWLYDCWTWNNLYNNVPEFGCPNGRGQGIPIAMGPWSTINFNFGSGGPAGLYDDYQIKWTGYIKSTAHWTPQFRTCGDDGMILKINGLTVVNNWWDRGGGCGASNGYYMENDGWIPIEIWWYENGGGAWGQLQWNIGNGFQVIPSSVFSQTIPSEDPTLQDKILAQQTAQLDYNNALSLYNTENDKLINYNENLTNANQNLTLANQNIQQTSQNLTNAQNNYDTAIFDMQLSIIDAKNEYSKQWNFEEKQRVAAAIATALANQIQPTPEPTINPTPVASPDPTPEISPEPTPEQTKPTDPTPEPTPETTPSEEPTPNPEPSPTVEPSPEPSPQPTDINPTPNVEPTQDPVATSDKTNNSPVSEQMANLIADLTNSSTLTKLSPEQKAAVAGTLGIKTEEIAKIAELAKSEPTVAKALEEFGDRANKNLESPMPYTLADATTEIATEQFLADPIGALTSINLSNIDFGNLGADMTDDQREKAQEVIIPVVIASNIVAAAMTRRK